MLKTISPFSLKVGSLRLDFFHSPINAPPPAVVVSNVRPAAIFQGKDIYIINNIVGGLRKGATVQPTGMRLKMESGNLYCIICNL